MSDYPYDEFPEHLILDVETTALPDDYDADAEIIEIAIIGYVSGKTYMHTLVKPKGKITNKATSKNKITAADVENAPAWGDIKDEFLTITKNRSLYVYNKEFVEEMIEREQKRTGALLYEERHSCSGYHCVMTSYAKVWGDFDHEYFYDYRWQRLTAALEQQKIDISEFTPHRALDDALMIRMLLRRMWTGNPFTSSYATLSDKRETAVIMFDKIFSLLSQIDEAVLVEHADSELLAIKRTYSKYYNDLAMLHIDHMREALRISRESRRLHTMVRQLLKLYKKLYVPNSDLSESNESENQPTTNEGI